MKATINGIEVEGTPQEINELMSMQVGFDKSKVGDVIPKIPIGTPDTVLPTRTQDYVKHPWTTTISNRTVGCTKNGPCFCTGECQKLEQSWQDMPKLNVGKAVTALLSKYD